MTFELSGSIHLLLMYSLQRKTHCDLPVLFHACCQVDPICCDNSVLLMAGASSRLRQRAPPRLSTSSASRARRQRKRISYNEDVTDSEDFEVPIVQGDIEEPRPEPRARRIRTQPSVATRTSLHSTKKRKAPPIRKKISIIGSKRQRNTCQSANHTRGDSDHKAIQFTGRVMPWTTLPYHILASIFAYASQPLASVVGDPLPSVSWLLRTALVCKAFTEPALSALYFETFIHAPRQIHSLVAMLQNRNARSTINYRSKIRYLSIGPMHGLLKDPHAIGSIIPLVPCLRGIALGIHSDDPKLCRLHSVGSTTSLHEDMSLFSSLTDARTQLESWTWNRTLAFHYHPLSMVKEVHQSPPFLTLKSMTFLDFHLPATLDYNGKQTSGEEALADTISALPSLREIQFNLADIVNERLMPLLPGNLQTVVLTSCYNLFSPALEKFLSAKGQNIRELVLSHNQSLSLSFLSDLSRACPKLETLKMDLLYYNSHTTFKDSTPRYDSLLGEGELPSWPTSLRRVELLQLRRWKAPAAERFFASLVDSSESLPDLRHIEIKASVNESGWRDRIAFRDKWVQRLNEVFLRRSSPPKPYLQSFAAYREWKAQQGKPIKGDGFTIPARSAQHNGTFALDLASTEATEPTATTNDNDSDAPLITMRRSARVRPRKDLVHNESDNASSPSETVTPRCRKGRQGLDDSPSKDPPLNEERKGGFHQRKRVGGGEQMHVQGLCTVVDVVIDNLRPAEEQLHESDFLDEEQSGDEDWNGDEDMEDGRYAW